MKKIWMGTALAILALMGARSASAQAVDVLTAKCQAAIMAKADAYNVVLHKQIMASVNANILGKNKDADGGKACVGGPSAGHKCIGNIGACNDGARKAFACNDNLDCPGYCALSVTTTCTANADCIATAPCKGFGKLCNIADTKGCPGGRCEIKQTKGIAGELAKASTKLDLALAAPVCDEPMLNALGFPNPQCKGECASTHDLCPSDVLCGGAPGSCVIDPEKVADCIRQGSTGDLKTAVVGDALTRPLTRVLSTKQPSGAHTNKTPRGRSTISLPGVIQIGAFATADGAGSAGSSSPVGLARCTGAGVNDGKQCYEDADCIAGGIKVITATPPNNTAKCQEDCCTCSGAGACTGDLQDANINAPTKALCLAAGQVVCESRGNLVPPGNYLTNPTETKSNSVATCIATHLSRVEQTTAGLDATDKGHCSLPNANPLSNDPCDNDLPDCNAGRGVCRGGLSSFGSLNLTTGEGSTHAPIISDVWLAAGAPSVCPKCIGAVCVGGVNDGGVCGEPNNSTSTVCLPTDAGLWLIISGTGISNPFNLTSGTTSLTATGAGVFCGHCSGATTVGCSAVGGSQPCPGATGPCISTPVGSATVGESRAGFRGDPLYDDQLGATQQATAQGLPNNYGGTAAGLFCTGQTNSSLVDPAIGLAGPVRVVQPYIVNWKFSTK
jgi:hypothetical protein